MHSVKLMRALPKGHGCLMITTAEMMLRLTERQTCAFIFFLVLESPSCSIPEGGFQQGLENCPNRLVGSIRHSGPLTPPASALSPTL